MRNLKKNDYLFSRIIFPILLFLWHSAQAQLTTSNSLPPSQLVQTILLGSGVTASNITYNGAPLAIGEFNGVASNIGLPSGVIMSSGEISNAVGPNNTSGKSTGNYLPGDPDLDQIMSPTISYDATILEFDFIPTSDTIKFRYVFGSEEYMEYVSTWPGGINDGFGFFISGPGISGSFTNNAKNIALIPGTLLPVTMFNLNLNNNGAFYFDNGNGYGSGTAPDGTSVQYDGFTFPLSAITKVQCGQVYHIKLAIADGGDASLDSGVFLEAGSFASSGTPMVGPDIAVNLGCIKQITASNFNASSITWNSVYPGALGAYNNYLSCSSGCLNPTVIPANGAPPYIDYQICGVSTSCNPTSACDTIRVTFNPELIATITPQNPTLCIGQSSVSITANGNGGTPPFSYSWNNVNPSQSINVGNGIYTVGISDASGCPPVYSSVTVTSYSVTPSANAGADQTVCAQHPITTLNASVTGASGGVWSGGTGTFSPNNSTLSGVTYSPGPVELAAGFVNLLLTTTGNGSCSAAIDTIRITYIGFTETVSFAKTNVSCYGYSDGTAIISVPGTTPPYSYSWNTVPAQSSATANNLALGTYSVTITNGIGCTSINSVSISQPSPLAIASSTTHVTCSGGNNGSISATITGGTEPYTYLWSNGATTSQISLLTAQSYSLSVTDANSCVITESYTLTESLPILMSITPTDVNCFSGHDGAATSIISGGTSPYTYSWNYGATSPNVSGLTAGTYTLTVKDFNQCSATGTVIINAPSAPLVVNTNSTNETCNSANDGTATAVVSGGSPGYSYSWTPGILSTNSINNLSSGTYTLTVTDINGCKATAFAVITGADPLTVDFINQINVSCLNGTDGTVEANPSGGIPNYTYFWSNGATTAQLSNLNSQSYTVTVTDTSGCTATNTVTITQPAAFLSVAVSSTNALCYGAADGSVSSITTGGTMPYSYLWMPGNFTTSNLNNITAGTYTITAIDTQGCMATNSATINQPSEIVLVTSSINADCGQFNGQTSVIVSGGTSPYTYIWSPLGGNTPVATGLFSGAYSVMVTDSIGCTASQWGNVNENSPSSATILSVTNVICKGDANGTATAGSTGGIGPFTYSWMPSGGTNALATGLATGSYTVTVTDSAGCQSLATLNPGITEPPVITITFTKSNVSCFGDADGSASAIVSGGTPGYTYLWMPGGSTDSSITNISANTYTLQVTDANNCNQTISVVITEPLALTSLISSTNNVSCKGGSNGSATVTASGGTQVYHYKWLPSGGTGLTETHLLAGSYTVTTTDFKGCTTFSSVTITEPAQALSATSNIFSPSCFGASTGTVSIDPTGGTAGYSYMWNPPVSVSDTAFGLSIGSYSIVVSDTNNCKYNMSVELLQAPAINGNMVIINPSCGLTNGSISLQVSGGIVPYAYMWSPGGSTNSSLSNISPGLYSVQITDSSNCSTTFSANLTNDPPPTVSVLSTNPPSCLGANDGSVTLNITQGTAPYSINWSPFGGTNLTASALTAGTYTVNVIDAAGCQLTDSVTINEPTAIAISILSITDVLCNGGSTGEISLAVSGGTGSNYSYSWTPGGSSNSIAANLSIGTYTATVTDSNNCMNAISATIAQPSLLSSTIDSVMNPVCFNGGGVASVVVSGGVIPYSYSWSPSGDTTNIVLNLSAGVNTVTSTDANGCSTSNNVLITEPPQVITTAGADDTLCLGQSGTLSATATGGAGNYYFAWQPSGAITSGVFPVTPASSTTYTVIAYDQIGCQGTPITTTALVYTLDSSNIQTYANTPICLGQSSELFVETLGAAGPLTYLWDNNLGNGTGIYTVSPTVPTTYMVTVSNFCGLSITDSVTVYINLPPTVNFSSDSSIVCVPGTMLFFDSTAAGNPNDPITSWSWDFGDGTSSTVQNPAQVYNQAGIFPVSLTVSTSNGCTDNNLLTPVTITAYPLPTALFSVSATNLELPQDLLIINNQSSGATSYDWTFGDGETSTASDPQYLYTSVGVFQVQLIAMSQEGCLDTSYTEITTNADVIFPNAFTPHFDGAPGGSYSINSINNDVFFPHTSGVIEYELLIFNRWGEKIFESFDVLQGWDGYYRGALCPQDVYVWKAYIKLNNGKEFNKSGNVLLLQ